MTEADTPLQQRQKLKGAEYIRIEINAMAITELIMLLALTGMLSGFTAGLFGLGGGAVLIPALLWLLPLLGADPAIAMHQAIATSLALIVPSALMATRKQYKLGNLSFHNLKSWIFCVLLGTIVAGITFKNVPSLYLKSAFIAYIALCCIYMYFKKVSSHDKVRQVKKISLLSLAPAGIFVGMLSTFLGIGGGTFTVPYYISNDYPMIRAIAISSLTGCFIGLIATISAIFSGWHVIHLSMYSLGYVNGLAWLVIAPFSMYAAVLGVKVGNQLKEQHLKIAYIIFLLLIDAFLLYESFIR